MEKEREKNIAPSKAYCPVCGEVYDAVVTHCPDDGEFLFEYRVRDESKRDDPLLGNVLDGRFRLDRVLGQGGMGKVYEGMQLSVNRKVAIKVLRPDLCDNELVIRRFWSGGETRPALSGHGDRQGARPGQPAQKGALRPGAGPGDHKSDMQCAR
ncbi:MAG: hypothetical protein H0U74_02245 [Bradymonadaceae bacterium]|nr:hypothetical protein [Lujinxingiaceae bacterium]